MKLNCVSAFNGEKKDAVGRFWAVRSGGKCLYATVYKSDGGFDFRGWLDKLFG